LKLEQSFYLNADVCQVAQDLLGKVLFCKSDGVISGGMIVETEAYSEKEKACHAYNGRRTKRTSTLFERGGTSYVYLCYGMYHLFNVVTNVNGVAEAVLIRAVEPVQGVEYMVRRRNARRLTPQLTSGPGKLSIALGIGKEDNGLDLSGEKVWIEEWGISPSVTEFGQTTRVGVDYAGDDAQLPWRFILKGNPYISNKGK